MTSILNSKDCNTYVSFYVAFSKTFEDKNIRLLNSSYYQYDCFNITFIKIDEKYTKAFVSRYITLKLIIDFL